MIKIDYYYKLEMLSNELKEKNKLRRSTKRLDCTKWKGNEDYKGVSPFMNSKGMFFLSLRNQNDFVKSNVRRMTEYSLIGQGMNFTGLYNEDILNPNFYFGYPNSNPCLPCGLLNPVFEFRNDLYLFIANSHLTEIEILVFRNCKGFASDYLQCLINGDFDKELDRVRILSKMFYNYNGE